MCVNYYTHTYTYILVAGVTEYCSVEVPTSNRLTSSSGSGSKTTHSLDHYVMVSPQELTHTHRPGRVKVNVGINIY